MYFDTLYINGQSYVGLYVSRQQEILTLQAFYEENFIGVVVCKLEDHRGLKRGYIAMLAVKDAYRGMGVATKLVQKVIKVMIEKKADEVALETEVSNTAAMALYENLGFMRSKRLHSYYLNAGDAVRFLLPLTSRDNIYT
ncbi:N-alpha-acetyltransferase 30 [Neolecta irregularis DAH-3]|uniref:N-alpha-acetyltransferase 30 n=1 Tax=Neolecta irregularis (strain DAH-3) TaxID=1198029 RepID=A0A1U7LHQ5_NEOID|nr:N-alpha-acetyltransferase 30 [Neolecta irregularis DAH-3]|eukprot:OLL22185.1 N-alpha-acetyltransferase 30 [Neolecta irregularis DAH-3]